MPSSTQPLTKLELIDAFHRIGISKGSRLVVHSALRGVGPIDGGADALLEALLDCIGPDGLLVMPTFTYTNPVFDPRRTPSRTGVLTERLRLHPAAVRSLHPTHSVAAIGAGAEALCEGHHLQPGLGAESPLGRLARTGGGILLLGVGHTSNSTVHVGEAVAGVPYLDIPFFPDNPTRVKVLTGEQSLEAVVVDPPGCSRAFGAVEAPLRRRGAIRDGMIGKALAQWMSGEEAVAAVADLLLQDNSALLCTDPACYRCSRSRGRLGL